MVACTVSVSVSVVCLFVCCCFFFLFLFDFVCLFCFSNVFRNSQERVFTLLRHLSTQIIETIDHFSSLTKTFAFTENPRIFGNQYAICEFKE